MRDEERQRTILEAIVLLSEKWLERTKDTEWTKEEAEKAVEKLKAWKRLKNYNVKFNLDFVKNKIDFTYTINNPLLDVLDGQEQIFNNMKIVFGGEE